MKEEFEYTGLISPDTYEYLDDLKPEDLINDPFLEEQEEMENSFLSEEDEEELPEESYDDSDAYNNSDLFSYDDEDEYEDEELQTPQDTLDSEPVFDEDEEDDICLYADSDASSIASKIITWLKDDNNEIVNYLKSCNPGDLEDFNMTVQRAKEAFLGDKKDKVFFIPETDITVLLVKARKDPMIETQRKEYIASEMVLRGKEHLSLLFLEFSQDDVLSNVSSETVSRATFSDGEWRIILSIAQKRQQSAR